MQCWSCGFENVPGLAACGRCASRLDLSHIAVEPPRATRWRVMTRLATTVCVVECVPPVLRRLRDAFRPLTPEEVSFRTLARCIVPGWGLFRDGRRLLGGAILGLWLALGIGLILSLGTARQPLMLMLMIAVHGMGFMIVLAGNLAWERLIVRAAFGLVVFGALYLLIYAPIGWLVSRLAYTLIVANASPVSALHDGDALLLAGRWLPQDPCAVGDIVLYEIQTAWGNNEYVRGGPSVDRIVAGSGDHVVVKNGQLLVNNVAPEPRRRPLGEIPRGLSIDCVVAADEFVILPTTPRGFGRMSSSLARSACLIRRDEVVSRVLYRVRPLERWGPLE